MIYAAFLISTLLVLLLVFYIWQYHMVFTPVYYREEPLCQECSLIYADMPDGTRLEGGIYEPKEPTTTLLVFVGRSHDGVAVLNRLAALYPMVRIVTFNYRGYGKSQGRPSEKHLLEDGLEIARLVQKNYGSFSILGYSIGSSVAAFVAAHTKVEKLFLVGAFDSMASLAKERFGFDFGILLRYRFDTAAFVKEVKAPVYLFVSRDDRVTYIQNARRLREAIVHLAYYCELEGLSHKEILWHESVTQKIAEELS